MLTIARLNLACAGLGVSALTACAGPQIRATAPRPNLVIQDGNAPAALPFGDEVVDEFDVPNSDALSDVRVSGWRTTLTFGFRNGLRRYRSNEQRLSIDSTKLTIPPTTINGSGATLAVVATIRYRARPELS